MLAAPSPCPQVHRVVLLQPGAQRLGRPLEEFVDRGWRDREHVYAGQVNDLLAVAQAGGDLERPSILPRLGRDHLALRGQRRPLADELRRTQFVCLHH